MAPILRYFVVRPAEEVALASGEVEKRPEMIVPLIPMDLIPEGIDIKGIPRLLTLSQTMGMTNVGTNTLESDISDGDSTVQQQSGGSTSAPTSAGASPPRLAKSKQRPGHVISQMSPGAHGPRSFSIHSSYAAGSEATHWSPVITSPTRQCPSSASTKDSGSPNAGYQPRSPGPQSPSSSQSNGAEEPLYCQPWCHHGMCHRGDKCRSRHEMPATLEGLKKVGLEKLPYWYTQGKVRRDWQGRGKEKWSARRHSGRASNISPGGSTQWSLSRHHARLQNYEDKIRAENLRAMELMNRDNPAEKKSDTRDIKPGMWKGDHIAREHQDLISMECAEPLAQPILTGQDN